MNSTRKILLVVMLTGTLSIGAESAGAQSRLAGRRFDVTAIVGQEILPIGTAIFGADAVMVNPLVGVPLVYVEIPLGTTSSLVIAGLYNGYVVVFDVFYAWWNGERVQYLGISTIMSAYGEVSYIEIGREVVLWASIHAEVGSTSFYSVDFTAKAEGPRSSGLYYFWDFDGDGVADAEGPDLDTVSHVYPKLGVYSASVRVQNAAGNTATASTMVRIDPRVRVEATNRDGFAPLDVSFSTSLFNTDAAGLHYWWDFDGDGEVDRHGPDLQQVGHVYEEAGTYTVTLWVSNAAGDLVTDFKSAYITCRPFEASFQAEDREGFAPHNVVFTAEARTGNTTGLHYWWDFDGDGAVDLDGSDLELVSHVYEDAGSYSVSLRVTNAGGDVVDVTKTDYVAVHSKILYVSPDGSDEYPYANWAIAATSIQAAVDAAKEGAAVIVADGVYNLSAPLRVTKDILVISANGPETIFVDGNLSTQCFVLDSPNAVIDGFTITRGSALEGAGVYAASGTVRNCIITGSVAEHNGGGIYGGTIYDSILFRNTAGVRGGGAFGGFLDGCTISENTALHGGGAFGSTATSSILSDNTATVNGGGSSDGNLLNCVVSANEASVGGGAYKTAMRNCLVSGNAARFGGGLYGGGSVPVWNSTFVGNEASREGGGVFCHPHDKVWNCIVYYNKAPDGPNWSNVADWGWSYTHCCTFPAVPGVGNIVDPPQFLDRGNLDFRLAATSPCIDAGLNEDWMTDATDLDGNPRIMNGTVDVGAYETP